MDVKKENNKNIASKKDEMQMIVNEGKNFFITSKDKHRWWNDKQREQYYFMGLVFVLLEQLVDDFYKTELDSADL